MALVVNDRVKETSTTTGTGTLTLDGAVTGFETFSSAIGNTNTTYYAIELPNTAEFEVGLGTVSAGQLARTTVISSSNSDALVNFSAGTKNVFCTLPASKAVIKDASDNVTLPADLTVDTNTLYVDSSNNRVGINDSTPSQSLDVSGRSRSTRFVSSTGGAAADAAFYLNDTNGLGIFSPAANEFAISTSASERLRIDSSGNVGIGTTSPDRSLHISQSVPIIKGTDTDTSSYSEISFSGGNVDIRADQGNTSAGSYIIFRNDGSEIARFDSSGNLGIGTSSPASALDVTGTITADKVTINTTVTNGLSVESSTTDVLKVNSSVSSGLIAQIGATHYLGIKDDGTDLVLEAKGFGGNASGLKITTDPFTSDVTRLEISKDGDISFYEDTGTTQKLFWDASTERLGIGTTSPSTLLHLSSADPQITITDTDGTGSQVIKAVTDNLEIVSSNHIKFDADSGLFVFKDSGVDALSITNTGNIIFKPVASDSDLVIKGNDGGSEITALTLDMSEAGAATFNDKVILGANKVIEFGDAGETISGDGTDLNIASSSNINLDAAGGITLDAGTSGIKLDDDGTTIGLLYFLSGNLNIKPSQSDTDLVIKGNDGGSEITALTLDMSEAGAATFNSSVTVGANLDVSSGTIKLDGNYPEGSQNVVLGDAAGDALTGSSSANTLIGHQAGTDMTIGFLNTAVGTSAMANVTDGAGNNAFGNGALSTEVSGNNNTAIGEGTLDTQNGGGNNTALGVNAGGNVTTGSNLTLLGYNAQPSSATATNEITLGDANVTSLRIPGLQSGASSGDILTYDGTDIGLSTPTFISNVVEDTTPQLGGDLDLNSNNITGTGNIDNVGTITTDGLTVAGNVSVDSGTIKLDGNYPTGTNNVALGNTALDSLTSGNQNTAIGANALTAITTQSDATAIGYNAASSTTGGNNTAIGSSALNANVTGTNNTVIGKSAARQATSNNNTAVGHEALDSQTGGYNNTAVGQSAGSTITSGNNLTVLGYNAEPSAATATNEITLGDANVTSLRIPGLASGASSGDVLTYDGTDITLSAPTGVSAGFSIAMAIAL